MRYAILTAWILLTANVLSSVAVGQPPSNLPSDHSEKKVRPLLESRCLECHSKATYVSGGLALDSRQGWVHGGDSGSAIDLTDWKNSLLWRAVGYRNPHLQMPPDGKLNESELAILQEWLSNGAFDPRTSEDSPTTNGRALRVENAEQHWAYRPIDVAKYVEINEAKSIDDFLQQQLKSIDCSPRASTDVLLQRLIVDLHGIRPTVEQLSSLPVAALKEDSDTRLKPNSVTHALDDEASYRELVDSLLESPRFGERFARNWMDVVRFAESITLRGFVLPDAWRYRNYLIKSFNTDKPISEFIREQVAGDLIQSGDLNQRQDQLIATSMLALGDTNLEEQDKKQLEMDYVDEQIDVIGKAFLAQTIGCARCHDHKFDPIPTKDYYAIAGILKSSVAMEHSNVSNWIQVPLPLSPEEHAVFEEVASSISKVKKQLEQAKQQLKQHAKPSLIVPLEELRGIVIDDSTAKLVGSWDKSTSIMAYVGAGYLHDQNKDKGTKSVTFEPKSLPAGSYRVRLSFSASSNRATNTLVRVFSADGESIVRVNQREAPKDDGLWQTIGTFRFENGGQSFVIISNEDSDGHVIADAIQFLSDTETETGDAVVSQGTSPPNAERAGKLQEEINSLESRLKVLEKEQASRPMVITVRPATTPSDIAIHIRGSVHQLGAVVPRGCLSCLAFSKQLPLISQTSNGRMELANWLAHDENPLTARVYVNRIWSWLMGQGIVRTVDNFGTTGETPTHPELLDWLTVRFIQHGWSTKWLVREIVCSEAYKRSSRPSANAMEIDPDNKWLGRGQLRRLDAEVIRDTLLCISGELNLRDHIESNIPPSLKEDYGFRHTSKFRSVYGPWLRNSLPEHYSELDGANPCFSIGKRSRSTIAQQSLAILNNEWVYDRCVHIGKRMSTIPETSRQKRIELCFLAMVNRLPTDLEIQWALNQFSKADSTTGDDWATFTNIVHYLVASIDFRFIE